MFTMVMALKICFTRTLGYCSFLFTGMTLSISSYLFSSINITNVRRTINTTMVYIDSLVIRSYQGHFLSMQVSSFLSSYLIMCSTNIIPFYVMKIFIFVIHVILTKFVSLSMDVTWQLLNFQYYNN